MSARSYLSLNRQLKSALRSIKAGHPVIYGVELAGDPNELESIASREVVARFAELDNSGDLGYKKFISVRPSHLENRAMDDHSATLSGIAVYHQLAKIANSNGDE
jgi:hypothetical protein